MHAVEEPITITGRETKPVIRTPLPGQRSQKIIDDDHQFIATTTKTSPIVGRVGKGAVILTEDGNVFLDFTSGVGVVNTGHCHPKVVQAVQEQAARLMHFAGTDFYYDVQATLARELTKAVPGPFSKKVFFAKFPGTTCPSSFASWAWTS